MLRTEAEDLAVNVAASEHESDAMSAELFFLLESCGERGCAGAFGQVVGVAVVGEHGGGDFGLGYQDEARDVGDHDFEGVGVGAAEARPSAMRVWLAHQ